MVDRVEASKNLELLKANQSRLMNYNHLYSSYAFRQDCGAELRKIGKQIASIEELLHEKSKRLAAIRKLPCIRCGNPDSQAAHSNSAKHGKGRSIKASDEFTVPLCHSCHSQFDQFKLGNREESEKLFEQWLVKTELMMGKQKEVF